MHILWIRHLTYPSLYVTWNPSLLNSRVEIRNEKAVRAGMKISLPEWKVKKHFIAFSRVSTFQILNLQLFWLCFPCFLLIFTLTIGWSELGIQSFLQFLFLLYLWVSKMFLLMTFQNRQFLDNAQCKKVFKGTSAWEGGRRQYRDPDTINFIALECKNKGGKYEYSKCWKIYLTF